MIEKRYLGDSVYAEIENGMIKLTTDNGGGPSNTIYLEVSTYLSLVEYFEAAKQAAAEPHSADCLCDACICAGCGQRKHEGSCR
jgi:hypothetical protein